MNKLLSLNLLLFRNYSGLIIVFSLLFFNSASPSAAQTTAQPYSKCLRFYNSSYKNEDGTSPQQTLQSLIQKIIFYKSKINTFDTHSFSEIAITNSIDHMNRELINKVSLYVQSGAIDKSFKFELAKYAAIELPQLISTLKLDTSESEHLVQYSYNNNQLYSIPKYLYLLPNNLAWKSKIIVDLVQKKIPVWEYLDNVAITHDIDQILSTMIGIPEKSLTSTSGEHQHRKLVFAIRELQKLFGSKPFLTEVGLSFKENFSPSPIQLEKLIQAIIIRLSVEPDKETAQSYFKNLNLEKMDSENLLTLIEKNKANAFERIPSLLQVTKELEPYHLYRLEDRWGNIDPILILIGRYKNRNPQFLALIGKILVAASTGRFKEFKFSSNLSDLNDSILVKNQLSSLKSPEEFSTWTKERSSLTFFEENLSKDMSNNLTFKIAHLFSKFSPMTEENFIENSVNRQNLLSQVLKEPIANTDKLKKLKKEYGSNDDSDLLLVRDLTESLRKQKLENITLIKNTLGILERLSNEVHLKTEPLQEIQSAVSNARKLLSMDQKQQMRQPKEGIIFSTLTVAPNLLFRIGDLVDAFSCIHYQTGNNGNTLLSLVADANTQASLSFFISREDFDSPEIFRKIKSSYQKGKLGYYFSSDKLKLTLTDSDTGNQIELPLKKAMLRRLVKLGTTSNGQIGLKTEEDYKPTPSNAALASGVIDAINYSADSLFNQLKNDLEASSTGPVNFAPTRNPLGLYSDKGGGFQSGKYIID